VKKNVGAVLMISEWNILEDILKNQKQVDAQIESTEQKLAVLDEKRKALQARIDQLKGQKQSVADEQLAFDRLFSYQFHRIMKFRWYQVEKSDIKWTNNPIHKR